MSPLESLAYDRSSGSLYATDYNGILYSLDKTTAVATAYGNTGLDDPEGLAFDGSSLYCTSLNRGSTIYEVDPSTGATTPFVTGDQDTGPTHALTFDDDKSLAYVVGDKPGPQGLWSIATDGTTTLVGTIPKYTAALANGGGGRLYALDKFGNESYFDPATGLQTNIGNTGGQFWIDMTVIDPVPEPSALAALGLGAVAVLRRRKRA